MNPEAYITATRQCIAQANSWSLEELMLDVTITDGGADTSKASMDECSFGVIGKCLLVVVHVESESIFLFSYSLSSLSLYPHVPFLFFLLCLQRSAPTELHLVLKGMG